MIKVKMKKPIIKFLITLILGSFVIKISGSNDQANGDNFQTVQSEIKK